MKFNQLYTFTLKSRLTGQGFSSLTSLLSNQSGEWLNGLHYLPPLPFDFDYAWMTDDGRFTKRVAKYYYQQHGITLPDSLLSAIGNTVKAHTLTDETFHFDFTQQFDWEDGDFGDDNSCYWGSNSQAINMLYDNGACAIRFYDDNGDGMARAWLYDTSDFWVLWNGYGLQGTPTLVIAQIFSDFMGLNYKRISLVNHGSGSGTLYINGSVGYAIGTLDAIHRVSSFDLQFDTYEECYDCGRQIDSHTAYRAFDENYCEYCFYETYTYCDRCGDVEYREDTIETSEGDWVCDYCYNNRYNHCPKCDTVYHGEKCPTCRERETIKK